VFADITQTGKYYLGVLSAELPAETACGLDFNDNKGIVDALGQMDVCGLADKMESLKQKYLPTGKPDMISQQILSELLDIAEKFAQAQHIDFLADICGLNQLNPKESYDYIHTAFVTLINESLNRSSPDYSHAVKKAVEYIHGNYVRDISLASAAKYANVSLEHLSRQFRKETGASFVEYLTDYRLAIFKRLSEQPDMPVKEASLAAGFHNYNYFLRLFKKKLGHTPTQKSTAKR